MAAHPSASCLSDPNSALGLQHDVEATPKGRAILNADVTAASRRDTQLLIDASDAPGRCHDQGAFGLVSAPQGGLEIIDVTDVGNPVAIGLTSHIGEAHTVNVDPRRPHIAYASTSDNVTVNEAGVRQNEVNDSSDENDLDGFEVVDLSSCMNFPAGTTVAAKRNACRPRVYRYRYPSTEMSLGHTNKTGSNGVFGCHELEVYPDERLTCASGNALIAFNMSGVFDNRGTPSNFADDRPRGSALPCRVRDSSSVGILTTAAKVTDCVDVAGAGTEDLAVPEWRAAGSPSLRLRDGSAAPSTPAGESSSGAADPKFDSTQDIDFDHEAELTHSGRFVIASDERGGGVAPPGASCSQGADVKTGNGGIARVPRRQAAAQAPGLGGRRPRLRTPHRRRRAIDLPSADPHPAAGLPVHRSRLPADPGPEPDLHGLVLAGHAGDRLRRALQRHLRLPPAGYFLPASANQWVSHVFRVDRNGDGSFTYWAQPRDFSLGAAGRNSVDVYRRVGCPRRRSHRPHRRDRSRLRALQPAPARSRVSRRRRGPRAAGLRRERRSGDGQDCRSGASRTAQPRVPLLREPPARRARGGRLHPAGPGRPPAEQRPASQGTRVGPRSTHASAAAPLRPRLRRAGRGVAVVRSGRSRIVFTTRRGRVRYVGVASRSVVARRSVLRRYMRLARPR